MIDFLDAAGWGEATRVALAGDASSRRYTRLHLGSGSAILMEDPGGSVARFAALARYLQGLGLSAPEILAVDADRGLMLLEDFGDGLFARLAAQNPAAERDLYLVATDALLHLHRNAPATGLEPATPERLAGMTDLAFDCYAPRAGGAPDGATKAAVADAFAELLDRHAPDTRVTVLRDFHAENLIWLGDRDGAARAGLLDFQDALLGHPAYDLVSLVEDARRDVAPETAAACFRRYLDESGLAHERFGAAAACLAAQRNLRILGVFARLAATRGKPHYIDLVPRVWDHLQRDLEHPALAPLRPLLSGLPAPGPKVLDKLKAA